MGKWGKEEIHGCDGVVWIWIDECECMYTKYAHKLLANISSELFINSYLN